MFFGPAAYNPVTVLLSKIATKAITRLAFGSGPSLQGECHAASVRTTKRRPRIVVIRDVHG